jgi:hypothetical protein
MKFFILLSFLLSSTIVSAKTLSCQSLKKVEGWDGSNTNENVLLSSTIKGKDLVNPILDGAYKADYVGDLIGKTSTNGKWVKYKYLEDAWCWFSVSLPVNFTTSKKFPGFVDVHCEGYSRDSFEVLCQSK